MAQYSLEKRAEFAANPDLRAPLPAFTANPRMRDPALCRPSPELADAVNVALHLGIPLLLTGEPGCGKTELVWHLAWYFRLGEPLVFNAKTGSVATDLFYHYDALGHFQYSQNNAATLSPDELEKRFVRYQALGAAIRADSRRVVLIDEVDKAPRDLPNDLLDALDKLRFDVPELGKSYETSDANRPVIVLTSNSEKNLPDAFLRRVAYFHIEFPKPDKMLEILGAKVLDLGQDQLEALRDHFYALREDRELRLEKLPATAELLQWAAWLRDAGFPIAELARPRRPARLLRHPRQNAQRPRNPLPTPRRLSLAHEPCDAAPRADRHPLRCLEGRGTCPRPRVPHAGGDAGAQSAARGAARTPVRAAGAAVQRRPRFAAPVLRIVCARARYRQGGRRAATGRTRCRARPGKP